MELICVGTGSTGNTYILTNKKETLILDCGMRFLDVKKALDFKIRSIKGVVVSHVHQDHFKYAHEYEAAGIPVWHPYRAESLRGLIRYGGFTVHSFRVVHNVPCCGFLVEHIDLGKLLYVTDTEYVPYTFKALNVMLIEANYSAEYVDKTQSKYKHVVTGHMSLQTTADCIKANSSDSLHHVILCHLSANNADPNEFRETIENIVPAGCQVSVAGKGMKVDLAEVPF